MSRCFLPILVLFSFAAALPARQVAITIDDLPRGGDLRTTAEADRAMTAKLLAPFQSEHIPVTGFVNECRHPRQLKELLALWLAAGAELGNHTCSHLDLNTTSVDDYEADIVKGEAVTSELLGHRPVYFRYPFLHAGKDPASKQAIQDFLIARGYRNAPVTFDDSDYMFARVYATALTAGDLKKAAEVRDLYVSYMESIVAFFEQRSIEVTGHEVSQILLIHASQLNADAMPALLSMFRKRNYTFVSLEQALKDPAYALPETYTGTGGFSWIHRWSKTKGMRPKGEPEEPDWIRKEAGF